jgi:hypothetical protein
MLFINEADRLTLNAACIALGWESLEDFLDEGITIAEYPWVPQGTVIQGEWVSLKNLMRKRTPEGGHILHGLTDAHLQGHGEIIESPTFTMDAVKSDSGPMTS